MSNETTAKTATKSRAKKAAPAVVDTPIAEDAVKTTDVVKEHTVEKTKPLIPKEVDLNQLIPVLNGYQGLLVYKSARTNEKFVWPEFGSEQMVELRELRNANVVLNGSISIFAGSGSGNTSIGDIITSVENTDSKIQDLENELKEQADAIAGLDGVYFFVRYSDNEDGVPMYESPTDSTLYMGTCSTNTDVAPTDPNEYTWVKIRSDNTDGTPGLDGTSQYFHIKYSDDGETFTENNGEELGDWMGTCVTEEEADPTDFDAYEWHKIKGDPGTDGLDGKDGIAGKDGTDGNQIKKQIRFTCQ